MTRLSDEFQSAPIIKKQQSKIVYDKRCIIAQLISYGIPTLADIFISEISICGFRLWHDGKHL